jgi:hypothetical protein
MHAKGDDNDSGITGGKRRPEKEDPRSSPSRKLIMAGDSIVDITATPDVAVWAKEARRKGGIDNIKEHSKILSITTKSTTDEKMVDPANTKEVEESYRKGSLTDEASISKKKVINQL